MSIASTAQQQTLFATRSFARLNTIGTTTAGWGSSSTKVARFTNIATQGSDLTITQSVTLGDSITINTPGEYLVEALFQPDNSNTIYPSVLITKNAVDFTTAPISFTSTGILTSSIGFKDVVYVSASCSKTVTLAIGDVIRCHGPGSNQANNYAHYFQVTMLEKFVAVRPVATGTAYVKDVKAQNTAGGTFTSGADQRRDLGTLSADPGVTWITVTTEAQGHSFTLQPGTYRIEASAPGFNCDVHQAWLHNETAGARALDINGNIVNGSNILAQQAATANVQNTSVIFGTILITSATKYSIKHRCTTTGLFGNAGNFSTEVYTQVKIEKVG